MNVKIGFPESSSNGNRHLIEGSKRLIRSAIDYAQEQSKESDIGS